ncbi:MAG: aminoacyl-tRNA hydrolase, partial [Spirochaetales bacterium]|nr:aminoacyl-tRNA hydrolase [Spirochaetales bacterium]
GFMVIDELAGRFSIKFKKPFFKDYFIGRGLYQDEEIILIKPLTFMNRSGLVLPGINKKYIGSDTTLVVICDNMDLAYGECRVKTKGSDSGHNGMSSIIENYESSDFIRIYIGISRPSADDSIISHVLGRPGEEDFPEFKKGVERGASAAVSLLSTTIARVMSEYNRKNNQNKSS